MKNKPTNDEINAALDLMRAAKATYKKYYKNESSPLLRRLGAEVRNEGVRKAKEILKRL